MFVDECGDQNLSSFDENFPVFTLCGVLMSHSRVNFAYDILKDNIYESDGKKLGLK